MASPEVIYINSDNIVEVLGVENVPTSEYLNNADVTLTLVDAASKVEIIGQTWPLTLSYVTGSDGDYRGTIRNEAVLNPHQQLIAQVTVDAGEGLVRYWEKRCIAEIGD